MAIKVSKLDTITDLRRAISASYSPMRFSDKNFIIFLEKAEKNLRKVKPTWKITPTVFDRLKKAKDSKTPIHKRRGDLLIAANLLQI